jgi:guanylate kinase
MPKVFVISGNSGAGKTTIAQALIKQNPNLKKVITCTTREARKGEKDGRDYYFISKEEFESNIEKGLMAEYEKYSENYYGSRKKDVKKILESKKNVLFVVETKGALTLKKTFPKSVLFFVKAPSLKELENRLKKRGDIEENIKKRFVEIEDESEREKEFDFIIINDKLNEAIKEAQKIIKNSG